MKMGNAEFVLNRGELNNAKEVLEWLKKTRMEILQDNTAKGEYVAGCDGTW